MLVRWSRWEIIHYMVMVVIHVITMRNYSLHGDVGYLGDRSAWILPFTSGGFIYIAMVTVLPELLREKMDARLVISMALLFFTLVIRITSREHCCPESKPCYNMIQGILRSFNQSPVTGWWREHCGPWIKALFQDDWGNIVVPESRILSLVSIAVQKIHNDWIDNRINSLALSQHKPFYFAMFILPV